MKLKLLVLPLLLLLFVPASSAADPIRLRFEAVVVSAPDRLAGVGERFTGSFSYDAPGDEPFRFIRSWRSPSVRHLEYEVLAEGIRFDLAERTLATSPSLQIVLSDYDPTFSSKPDQLAIRARRLSWDFEIVLEGDGPGFFESVGIDALVIPPAIAAQLPLLGYSYTRAQIDSAFIAQILPGSIAPSLNPLGENTVPEPASGVLLFLGLVLTALRFR